MFFLCGAGTRSSSTALHCATNAIYGRSMSETARKLGERGGLCGRRRDGPPRDMGAQAKSK